MLTTYLIFLGFWAFCAGMTVFTTSKGMDSNIAWLIAMWFTWAAMIITHSLL